MSIRSQRLADTPIAVIDLETTGLSPRGDRIVEIAVVRIDPGQPPRLVLDTLVDPQRSVTCSEIHGIYDEDVVGAPLFHELLPSLATALDGAAIAAFNVYFDTRFLEAELANAKLPLALPHMCLMWLRPGLGLGKRATLENTCNELGIAHSVEHRASSDALATAQLWPKYLAQATARGIATFGDLADMKDYKFTQSFDTPTLERAALSLNSQGTALMPRRVRTLQERTQVRHREDALSVYWEAIKDTIVDAQITALEIEHVRALQARLSLRPEQIRYVHARILAGILDDVTRDLRVDSAEVEWLAYVVWMLRELGWAPGDIAAAKPRTEPARTLHVPEPTRARFDGFAESSVKPTWWQRMFGAS